MSLLAVVGLAAALQGAPQATAVPSLDDTVQHRIQPQAERLLEQLVREGRDLKLDGVPVFNGSDKFLTGKIALGLADFIAEVPDGDPKLAGYLADFREVAKLTVDDPNDSWGIYYYLSALNRLNAAGRLEPAVDRLTLAKLRVRLDWRSFVDRDSFELIDHPTNYYGVAFAIARLRERLGWDGPGASERLLKAVADHYARYSGPYGFSDETDGEGRFDRYSVLLAGELAERFLETGAAPPAEVRTWLRRSADVMLMRLNTEGTGFEYGRSLGPYSETAILEVLTAAAALDLLTPAEKALAYDFSARAAARYVGFWIDPATGSVNLWDGGRRTDAYRGKFRILGENLSLGHQYVAVNGLWSRMGYKDRAPKPDFAARLERLPKRQVTWFAKGPYDRLLVTVRDRGHVIGLPIVNGGVSQHMNSPYYPIPYANGMVAGVPDEPLPLLTPHFAMADGSVLAPLAYMRDVKVVEGARRTTVTWRFSEMDRLGAPGPTPDSRLQATVTYVLEPGRITRTDVYTARDPATVKGLTLAFAGFGETPRQTAPGRFVYRERRGVTGFRVEGLPSCRAAATEGARRYQTPNGQLRSVVTCEAPGAVLKQPLTVRWTLTYG